MKIIQGMKQIKMLVKKAEDLRLKVKDHCADLDFETPKYPDQHRVVSGWIQAHKDIMQEIARLRIAIARTNLATPVTIEIGGQNLTKSIAEWVLRRRDYARFDEQLYRMLTDRGLKEGTVSQSSGVVREVKIRRYFDMADRDAHIDIYRNEPFLIDSALEVANAVTDLIE